MAVALILLIAYILLRRTKSRRAQSKKIQYKHVEVNNIDIRNGSLHEIDSRSSDIEPLVAASQLNEPMTQHSPGNNRQLDEPTAQSRYSTIISVSDRIKVAVPVIKSHRQQYELVQSSASASITIPTPPNTAALPKRRPLRQHQMLVDAIDRSESIRSVIDLPPYKSAAGDSELVIARAGDRSGIDTIVSAPTEGYMDRLRDAEMHSLYAIRSARRRMQSPNMALVIDDETELDLLHNETRAALRLNGADESTIARVVHQSPDENMIQKHSNLVKILRRRQEGLVSSVEYGDLGIARHDGTRLRAGSYGSSIQQQHFSVHNSQHKESLVDKSSDQLHRTSLSSEHDCEYSLSGSTSTYLVAPSLPEYRSPVDAVPRPLPDSNHINENERLHELEGSYSSPVGPKHPATRSLTRDATWI